MTSEGFVEGLRNGDQGAWDRFMRREGRLALVVARRFHLGSDDSEELFQNTCLAAFRGIGRLKEAGRLSSWIYSIAYRQALDMVNRRRPEVSTDEPEAEAVLNLIAGDELTADEMVERFEKVETVRRAVSSLGSPCDRLLSDLYLAEPRPSYEAISRRRNMPIGSIGPTRARCLDKLRKALEAVSDGSDAASAG